MPITYHKQKIRIASFNAGENSTSEKTQIQTPFATIARNAVLDEPGKAIQREGLTVVGDNPDTLISKYTFAASSSADDKAENDGADTSISYEDGKFGKAANFNGTTSLITIPADSTIDITSMGACVFSTWVYVKSDGENDVGCIFSKGSHYARVHTESSETVKLEFHIDYGAGTDAVRIPSETIALETWTKLEFHYNADESLDIYIDGVQATGGTDTTGSGTVYDDSGDDLILGNNVGVTATFDGLLQDFRIYDGARTSDELEINKVTGLVRYKVGTTIDKIFRIRDVHLEKLSADLKDWTIVSGFTASTSEKQTNFVQANDELWILNGEDRPHVMDSSENFATRINPAIQSTGTGDDDCTSGGTYSGTIAGAYYVEIDAEGTPDTFKWKKDAGGYTSGVAITGGAQTLAEGVTVTFTGTDNHTLGDIWTIYVYPDEGKGKEELAADGTDEAPPKATIGAWAQNNRMFLSGHPTQTLRDYVWYSDPLLPHLWDTTLVTGNFFRVQSGTGGKVTWLQPFKLNELIIYKEDSIHVLNMTGDDSAWELQPINILTGCRAGRTVKDIGNDQIFLDDEGFVRMLSRTSFDKLKTAVISGPVQDILDQINVDAMEKACAELIDGRYYLSFPTGTSTENDTVIIWDSAASLAMKNPEAGWSVLPLDTWNVGYFTVHEFGDNRQSLVAADNRELSLTYQHIGNNDNGKMIPLVIAGPQHDGGNRGTDKIWGPMYLVADATDASVEIRISAELDNEGFIELGTLELSGGAPTLPIDLEFDLGGSEKSEGLFEIKQFGRGKTCRIKIENITYNENVVFNEYELHWQERILREKA